MDREKKAAECKVDSIGSGRAIPIKQVSVPFPLGLERSGEEAPAMLEDGSGRWERPAPLAPARPELLHTPGRDGRNAHRAWPCLFTLITTWGQQRAARHPLRLCVGGGDSGGARPCRRTWSPLFPPLKGREFTKEHPEEYGLRGHTKGWSYPGFTGRVLPGEPLVCLKRGNLILIQSLESLPGRAPTPPVLGVFAGDRR